MIVAGFGFRTKASRASLENALGQHEVTPDALATLDAKLNTLQPVADARGLPLIAVSPEAAKTQTTHTQSRRSTSEKGIASVAEATALAAAGPGATLIGARTISEDRMATCAIAKGPDT